MQPHLLDKAMLCSHTYWTKLILQHIVCKTNRVVELITMLLFFAFLSSGGVRHQVNSTVLKQFMTNKHMHLFDGSPENLCPHYSAAAKCSGLFEVKYWEA